MSNLVKLMIDGKEVEVAEGTNLVDAAQSAGIHVPNLCYIKGTKAVGACRLCLVEVEGMRAPMIACNTKVKEGMKVQTQTDKIKDTRKFVIDLVLSMHPLDCMTCTKAGVCKLQSYAYDFEIKESSFTRKKFGYPIDSANPFIKRDPEYCILCGKCVRACKEQGTNVIDFMGRGVGARVVTANDKSLQESSCTFCGSCVDACPVNALLEADRWRKGREWDFEKVSSVCLSCGSACDTIVSTADGVVHKINAGADEGSAERFICAYGRFGFDSLSGDMRVSAPMKRVDGQLKETTWEDALKIAVTALRAAGSETSILTSGSLLNEDALTLLGLAGALKIKKVDSTVSLYANADILKASNEADINTADVIVLAGMNPSQWDRSLAGLDAIVRKRVERGAKLVVVNSDNTRISEAATVNIVGDEVGSIKGIVGAMMKGKGLRGPRTLKPEVEGAAVSDDIEKAATLIAAAKNAVILSSAGLFGAASNIALLNGMAVAVGLESNAKGLALMGLVSGEYKSIVDGESKALYAIGELPITKRPNTNFLIVQASGMTELAKQADLILPAKASLESAGTIVDYLGRLKYLPAVVEPQVQARGNKEIFIELAGALGKTVKQPTEADVKKSMKVKIKADVKKFEKAEGMDVDGAEFIEAMNASVIAGSRLLWLKEAKVCSV